MTLREDRIPRQLTEDLVLLPEDVMEPYSMEARETTASLAEKIKEVLLAAAAGELDDYDQRHVFAALGALDDGTDSPLGLAARELAETLEDDEPADVEDLRERLDALVELAEDES